jgi:hypothetical protein
VSASSSQVFYDVIEYQHKKRSASTADLRRLVRARLFSIADFSSAHFPDEIDLERLLERERRDLVPMRAGTVDTAPTVLRQ